MTTDSKSWAASWESSIEHCGDLPSIHGLPHMGERAAAFAANMTGPKGERPKIEPSFIRRVVNLLKPSQETEVERLRNLVKKVLGE